MKKTLVFSSPMGDIYMWGYSDKYTLYLEKPKDRVIHLDQDTRKKALLYLQDTPQRVDENLYKNLEKFECMGLYGQFEIRPHNIKGLITLKYKRYIPEDVHKAYAAKKAAERENAGATFAAQFRAAGRQERLAYALIG